MAGWSPAGKPQFSREKPGFDGQKKNRENFPDFGPNAHEKTPGFMARGWWGIVQKWIYFFSINDSTHLENSAA
jgi:hypothetical protein